MCTQTLLYILYSTFHLTCYLPSNEENEKNGEILISQRQNDKIVIHLEYLAYQIIFVSMIHLILRNVVLLKEF